MPDHNGEFNTWFAAATTNAETSVQKGAKSIIVLTMGRLWKAWNDAIFKNTKSTIWPAKRCAQS
jgi:hypothetical protein